MFSAYPDRTRLLGGTLGSITDTPEVRPTRSSRTKVRTCLVYTSILKIDRQLDLSLGLVDRTEPPRAPGHQETRESQPGRYAELRSPLLLGIGSLQDVYKRQG